jgi:hypothetical protein
MASSHHQVIRAESYRGLTYSADNLLVGRIFWRGVGHGASHVIVKGKGAPARVRAAMCKRGDSTDTHSHTCAYPNWKNTVLILSLTGTPNLDPSRTGGGGGEQACGFRETCGKQSKTTWWEEVRRGRFYHLEVFMSGKLDPCSKKARALNRKYFKPSASRANGPGEAW